MHFSMERMSASPKLPSACRTGATPTSGCSDTSPPQHLPSSAAWPKSARWESFAKLPHEAKYREELRSMTDEELYETIAKGPIAKVLCFSHDSSLLLPLHSTRGVE